MNRKELLRYLILRTIGNFLVLFAIFGIVATFGPAIYYEISFKVLQARGVRYVIAATGAVVPTPSPVGQNPQITPKAMPTPIPFKTSGGVDNLSEVLTGPQVQILTPKDTKFSIVIPKIGASAKVYPNVDPNNENAFLPILQKGVAHAKGTVFPGMKGNIYLFAHSTDNFWDVGRYNAVFYLLKDLQPGDEVVIFFENKRHEYIVKSSKIVNPNDTSYIINSHNQNKEQLVLQTCWPPGTTWQRLLVFAEPK